MCSTWSWRASSRGEARISFRFVGVASGCWPAVERALEQSLVSPGPCGRGQDELTHGPPTPPLQGTLEGKGRVTFEGYPFKGNSWEALWCVGGGVACSVWVVCVVLCCVLCVVCCVLCVVCGVVCGVLCVVCCVVCCVLCGMCCVLCVVWYVLCVVCGVWCVVCGVWCGVVWCGVVWCGVVWCGVVWCGVVWCGVVWCGVVWCGVCVVLCCVCCVVCCVVLCCVLCCVVRREGEGRRREW